MTLIKVEQLTGGYGDAPVIRDISFSVKKGEFFGILGPNGSGKTTLLKILSGVLPFTKGNVFVKNKSIQSYKAKELAKIMAVLPQHTGQTFSYTVKETVSLGRYAHKRELFQTWNGRDEKVTRDAMEWTGVSHFQDVSIDFLSGGERQRVFLAQALAQEPEILLLDEPTNHLDLSYQKELLDLLLQWTRERKLTVVSIFHDINLAGLYCDRLLLMEKGEIIRMDTPQKVLNEKIIRDVYRTNVNMHQHPEVPAPVMVLLPNGSAENQRNEITEEYLRIYEDHVLVKTPFMLRTMSSGIIGSGFGWHNTFINRHVEKNYRSQNYREEMAGFVKEKGFDPLKTVGMMTAVKMENTVYARYEQDDTSIFVVVTAGTGNAVDVAEGMAHEFAYQPGTINTWVFVNGRMSEEAFIQAIMTATEAKVKALTELLVKDHVTGTAATGTSTDSMLIAATQQGTYHEFAGTITPLGRLIGKAVFECTTEALKKGLNKGGKE